jgi:lactate dehydrogenase-like 2-hydroxyacid dehydrogenase
MKILILGDRKRYEKYAPQAEILRSSEILFLPRDAGTQAILEAGADAGILFADAISRVDGEAIRQMKNLKMIHSEGVAYDGIDTEAAREQGVFVCNNKGGNAGAVAEQAIYLMLALLRSGIAGDRAVREGRQIEMKEQLMVKGITDLSDCRVGLVGMGDIGQATARRLSAFGCDLCYYSLHRKSPDLEKELSLTWMPLERLASSCDIISLHMAVTPETTGIIDENFLSRMKKTAWLINTARGDLIDNQALRAALVRGLIAGAGLDTVSPEPVTADNPLVSLPEDCRDRVIFSPHLGGITTGSFRRMHRKLWENAARIARGERPDNIVNGL